MPINCRDGLALAWWDEFPHPLGDGNSKAAQEAREATRSLRAFITLAWPVLEPATPLVNTWHLDAICEHLQAVTDGGIRNLLINIPPRCMKSLAVCVFWPAWEWIANPQRRFLFSAYNMGLSIRDSVKCRRLIQSPWYQQNWAERFQLCQDQNTKARYENDRAGHRIATSVGGSATGEGGDRVVVDDPHNVSDRESDAKREQALVWWDETMSTRLNDPQTGAKVIVMQRLHEKDLSGHVLEQGGYEHLFLAAEFEPGRKCVTTLRRGETIDDTWTDPREEDGELLWPGRIGKNEIADFHIRLGPEGYAGQFQQRPAPAGGALFRKEWFRYYSVSGMGCQPMSSPGNTGVQPVENESCSENAQTRAGSPCYWTGFKLIRAEDCDRFAVMDPAGTEPGEGRRPCYTVIQVWDVTRTGDMLLIHQYRRQVQAAQAAEAATKICREFDVAYIAIEKDGMGLGVVQQVRNNGIAVRAIKARGCKESRSQTAEIRMANGQMYFPAGAAFLFELEKELLSFPRSDYQDQVDALSYAAMQVQKLSRPFPEPVESWERDAERAMEGWEAWME